MVGHLSSWDPDNEPVLDEMGIPIGYRMLMRKLMVCETLQCSTDIATAHANGRKILPSMTALRNDETRSVEECLNDVF